MTTSRALRTVAVAAAVIALAAACATASAHSVSPIGSPAAAATPAPQSAQDELSALPGQVRTVAAACETALIPEMGAAEAGQNVVTPPSCTSLPTTDYQIATMAAEQQYYLQTHPGQTAAS